MKKLSIQPSTPYLFHRQASHVYQSKFHQSSLFSSNVQKEAILSKLKKGTLFRLSNHHRTEQQTVEKDSFQVWIEENSLWNGEDFDSKQSETIEPNFYLNYYHQEKQKKQKNNLPAFLQNIKPNQAASIFSPLRPKARGHANRSERVLKNFVQQSEKLTSRKFPNCIQVGLGEKISFDSKTNHKAQCFEQKLAQTKLLSPRFVEPAGYDKFYEGKQSLIKSQFYLNDHKKKGSMTFYAAKEVQLPLDTDLRRIRGIQNTIVKSFNSNLLKIKKETHFSCYDQVKKCLSSMKQNVSSLIQKTPNLRNKSIEKPRLTKNQNQDQEVKYQQKKNHLNQEVRKKCDARNLKAQFNEEIFAQNSKIKQQKHLPKFLLKLLSFSTEKPWHVGQIMRRKQKLRG